LVWGLFEKMEKRNLPKEGKGKTRNGKILRRIKEELKGPNQRFNPNPGKNFNPK